MLSEIKKIGPKDAAFPHCQGNETANEASVFWRLFLFEVKNQQAEDASAQPNDAFAFCLVRYLPQPR